MGTIDITTISTIRPSIIEKTFQSVKENFCIAGHNFRLILDVAPIGENGYTRADVVEVGERYFDHRVVRLVKSSPQAEAQKWVWSVSTSDYVLQWEDDWELLRRICFRELVLNFVDPTLAMVFFDREGKSVKDYKGYKGMFKQLDDNLYERTEYFNFGGPPALISQKFLQQALPYMRNNECLDVTCERADVQGFLKGWKFYVSTHPDGPVVRDIGKPWMKKHGFKKDKRSAVGFRWLKV